MLAVVVFLWRSFVCRQMYGPEYVEPTALTVTSKWYLPPFLRGRVVPTKPLLALVVYATFVFPSLKVNCPPSINIWVGSIVA